MNQYTPVLLTIRSSPPRKVKIALPEFLLNLADNNKARAENYHAKLLTTGLLKVPQSQVKLEITPSPIPKGTIVYWTDPDKISSGVYSVIQGSYSTDSDTIISVSDGHTDAEVLFCELEILSTHPVGQENAA